MSGRTIASLPSLLSLVALAGLGGTARAQGAPENRIVFPMVRSAAVTNAGCLPDARAKVTVTSIGPVSASGSTRPLMP